MNIYVGNLPQEVTEADLREAFGAYGTVASATVIKDRFSGQSRGFGFVETPTKAEAYAAIDALNGKELRGHILKVSEARPRVEERRRDGRRRP